MPLKLPSCELGLDPFLMSWGLLRLSRIPQEARDFPPFLFSVGEGEELVLSGILGVWVSSPPSLGQVWAVTPRL